MNMRIKIENDSTLCPDSDLFLYELAAAWYDLFQGNGKFANACPDRMLHQAFRIERIGESRRSR